MYALSALSKMRNDLKNALIKVMRIEWSEIVTREIKYWSLYFQLNIQKSVGKKNTYSFDLQLKAVS